MRKYDQEDDNEIRRLAALYELHILDTSPEERFDRLVKLATDLLHVPIGYIAFLDEQRQWFKSRRGLRAKQTPRNISFCNHTIQQNEPLVIPDTLLDKRFINSPLVKKSPFIRFYAGIPLANSKGFNVGTFCVADKAPLKLKPEQLKILQELAELVEEQLSFRQANVLLRKIKKQLELRNDFIRQVFSFYMSDDVVSSILDSHTKQKLGGKECKITILFSDLRNFTPLADSLPAEQLVTILNSYFTKMVHVIEKHKGTIYSFIGDAIMVIFGAPYSTQDDSLRAVACAIEMQLTLKKVNVLNKKKGLPNLLMGVGVNTGLAVVGNVGSKKRMQYSAIGTAVNLSSRIQDFSLGGQVLISEATYLETSSELEINGHLRVKTKGFDYPIHIYDVVGVKGDYHIHL
ncbi:adenylate cyclase [Legionella antarctica]|uniref:Adenylate cyclase n=1 Tax=Legionella antarctica TaxID=2708020 RepID=A0A6F8T6P4_9GAMM|nr:adenylate/guanylate cyclase domain-containing protein [Legionella antarctica]BCA95827.1 adenylate cyclase [Legionella antarctica]